MSPSTASPRFVVFGAGVLGSLYAARLAAAGYDVTLIARGRRLADLREHGLVVEDVGSGERSVRRDVRVLAAIPSDEAFAFCLVLVRKTQLADALPVLAQAARDEMDALNAELVSLARAAGVATPAMDALAARATLGGGG